ncbi:MAG: YwiC-like family protein [Candidatus Kapaibacterium sp.]|jgi:uncharacterized membrane protein HdeD (DUF308 family)
MSNFPFPKEHGAYVVLIAAWLLGIIFAPCLDMIGVVLTFSLSVSLFLLQGPLRKFLRYRNAKKNTFDLPTLILSAIGILSGLLLGIHSPHSILLAIPLLPIAFLYLLFLKKRSTPTQLSLIGFTGLSLAVPLVMLSSNCTVSIGILFSVWLFATLFFCSSVFCVEVRLSGKPAIGRALLYHFGALGIVVGCVVLGKLPYTAIIVMSIALARILLISIYHEVYRKLPLKYIGILESIVALLGVLTSAVPSIFYS